MSILGFLEKQFVDVIQWNEPEDGILATRYPMADMEIQNGGQLTVRESQMAAFVNEGKIADVFGPGLHTLNTRNLPLLTDLMNWDKQFESPFKSDVYFFSTRLQMGRRWGTPTPITFREKEFGAARLRAYGIYAYRIANPRVFFTNVCGTRDVYRVEDLEGQLRNTLIARLTDVIAPAEVAFLDMAAHQAALADKVAMLFQTSCAALGLALHSMVIENLSLADELQKVLDQRIGMNMAGNLDQYTQFQAAQALREAAANPGGAAGIGVGLAAGAAIAQAMGQTATRSCRACGKPISQPARFCPECGKPQA